jgi:hypothetical protein
MNARAFCFIALVFTAPSLAQNKNLPGKGQLMLPEFSALTDKASESVNVAVGPELLGLGCRFLSSDDPKEAAAKKLCLSLTGIYVRNYKFDKEYVYPKADIESVRRQLTGPGWNRIVETHNRKENTDVDVFILVEGGKSRGLAIIASEPREFTIANIVGNIELDQLHDLEGRFGVPDMNIEGDKPEAEKPAEKPAPKAAPKPAPERPAPERK